MERNEIADREKRIIHTSLIGIGVNLLLSAFKAFIGMLSNSIAIVLDAVNNLSDAFSASVTIIGIRLACKPADKEHPFGHGRLEYFTAIIIAAVIIFAGLSSLVESARKIINPEPPDYSVITFAILVTAILTKIVLGKYVSKVGNEVRSESLVTTGADALFDAMITGATLVAALASFIFGEHIADIPVDGILGAIISFIIMRSGVKMMMSPISELLGERIPSGLAKSIKSDICNIQPVIGAYDLMLHNYGPEKTTGAVNIAIPAEMTAEQIHFLSQKIRTVIYNKYGVLLTIGIYAVITTDAAIVKMQDSITKIVTTLHGVLQVHGMFIDTEEKKISFDIVKDFSIKDTGELKQKIINILGTIYPDYTIQINIDTDYSD